VYASGDDVPHLVLDAGTGLPGLSRLLDGAAYSGRIVLSHLHWDHYQGLPFCPPIDRPEARVTLHIPVENDSVDAMEVLARGFSPPHFPIGPDGLIGDWKFEGMTEGFVADGITAGRIAHKGGVAYGIRVELDGVSLAYLPDHALNSGTSREDRDAALRLISGTDLLIHDGQNVASEDRIATAYAHATIDRVLDLADEAGVGALLLTHHSPVRTDDALDELARTVTHTPQGRPVSFAVQGESVEVG
jgi:ribonuclease BN (tRNA processing enzyme)